MNDTEQRLAIAEACGWKFCPSKDNPLMGNAEPDVWVDPFGNKFWEDMPTHLPDYLNDLNALHGAWLTLDEERKIQFIRNLFVICGYDLCIIGSEITRQISAVANSTASQRAEVFLRTLGKWKDETK